MIVFNIILFFINFNIYIYKKLLTHVQKHVQKTPV